MQLSTIRVRARATDALTSRGCHCMKVNQTLRAQGFLTAGPPLLFLPPQRPPSKQCPAKLLLLPMALSLVAQPVLRTSPSLIPPRKPLRSQGPRRLTEKPPSAARNALPRTQMALNQLLRRCVHLLIIGAIDVVGQYKVA
jgi:hypothetical protein